MKTSQWDPEVSSNVVLFFVFEKGGMMYHTFAVVVTFVVFTLIGGRAEALSMAMGNFAGDNWLASWSDSFSNLQYTPGNPNVLQQNLVLTDQFLQINQATGISFSELRTAADTSFGLRLTLNILVTNNTISKAISSFVLGLVDSYWGSIRKGKASCRTSANRGWC